MEQVHFVERLPLLLGAVQEVSGRRPEVADVVDQDVDARIINDQSGFRDFSHHFALADVTDDGRTLATRRGDLCTGGRGRVRVDVVEHHVRTGRRQPPADAAAYALRAA